MLFSLLVLLFRIANGIIILPAKQYDSLRHHDPVYSRISTATTFGGEYEPSPRHREPPYHHPSIFPNPFLHTPFGGCDCEEDRNEREYDEERPHKKTRSRHEEDFVDRDRDLDREEPRQYIAKIREIPARSFSRQQDVRNPESSLRIKPVEEAFTYIGPGYN